VFAPSVCSPPSKEAEEAEEARSGPEERRDSSECFFAVRGTSPDRFSRRSTLKKPASLRFPLRLLRTLRLLRSLPRQGAPALEEAEEAQEVTLRILDSSAASSKNPRAGRSMILRELQSCLDRLGIVLLTGGDRLYTSPRPEFWQPPSRLRRWPCRLRGRKGRARDHRFLDRRRDSFRDPGGDSSFFGGKPDSARKRSPWSCDAARPISDNAKSCLGNSHSPKPGGKPLIIEDPFHSTRSPIKSRPSPTFGRGDGFTLSQECLAISCVKLSASIKLGVIHDILASRP
jgi:hypothetical protein